MSQEKTGKVIPIDTKLENINPRKEPLTAEVLKGFEGLENLDDASAQEIVISINTLCDIIYEVLTQNDVNKESVNNDNIEKLAA